MTRARMHVLWRMKASVLLGCVLLAGAVDSAGQSAAPAGPAPTAPLYRIGGRVVNALDGHPLQHAMVKLSEVPNGATVATVAAGEQGEFVFAGLAAKKYRLAGEAPGYSGAAYQQHEQFSTAIVTGAGLDTESLVLRLTPAATVSGTVVDEAGEPVRQAQVTLYGEDHGTGKVTIRPEKTAQTNDLGGYSMGAVEAGRYYLSVKSTPWYAEHPQNRGQEQGTGPGIVTGVDPALDVAYPLTFYPDVTDQEQAAAVAIKGGEEVHLNVRMKPVPALHLTVRRGPDEPQGFFPQLQMAVFGEFVSVLAQSVSSSPSEVEMVGLAPGRYKLAPMNQFGGRQPGGRQSAGGHMIDLAGGSAEVDAGSGDASASVHVEVVDEAGRPLPATTQIQLRGTGLGGTQSRAADDKGVADFAGIQPDEYRVTVRGRGRTYQVVRVLAAGKRLPGDTVHVAGGATSVTAVTSTVSVAVDGVAKRGGKPAGGVMVLLAPVDAIENAELYRRDQSDLDGSFTLPGVREGRYIVVAIDEGWPLEWAKPEVLSRYLAGGVPVEVTATTGRRLPLPDAVPVQPR